MDLEALSVQGILPCLRAKFETVLIEHLLKRLHHLLLRNEWHGSRLPCT